MNDWVILVYYVVTMVAIDYWLAKHRKVAILLKLKELEQNEK